MFDQFSDRARMVVFSARLVAGDQGLRKLAMSTYWKQSFAKMLRRDCCSFQTTLRHTNSLQS